jgi:hypothetical protein
MSQQQVKGTAYAAFALKHGAGGSFPSAVSASESSISGPECAVAALIEYLELELNPKLADAVKACATSTPDRWAYFDRMFSAAEAQVGLPRYQLIRDIYVAAVQPPTYDFDTDGTRVRVTPRRDYAYVRFQCDAYLVQIQAALNE